MIPGFISGLTGKHLVDLIRRNRIEVSGDVRIDQITESGTFLSRNSRKNDGDGGDILCHCEAVEVRAKEADCTGEKMKHYCNRALQYTRNGATGALADRLANSRSSSTDDLSCELTGEGIDWFFVPTVEQVSSWLATMVSPPPNSGTYRVTMFFDCSRGVTRAEDDGNMVPCGDETSSQIDLVGICYGNH